MLRIGIVGGGVGGLAAALALHRMGHKVAVHEQSRQMARVGADVNLTPNAIHALDGLGVGAALRATAARPTHRISRTWDSGAETSRLPMSAAAEKKYGAPQLTIHRADLLAALTAALPQGVVTLGQRLTGLEQDADGVTLSFAEGPAARYDMVLGADGIHSVVRGAAFGPDSPRFTGLVSWRGVFARERAPDLPDLDAFTKWWGPEPDRQIVTFPLSRGTEIFVFATHQQSDWAEEGWTLPGDLDELRSRYADFHPQARALLAALDSVTRSALHVREPMPDWTAGRVTLLGDSAHPMVPFMAQGACMAIEDSVVLARAVEGCTPATLAPALARYQAARIPRTSEIQRASLANEWLRGPGNADWVYGYHAWTVEV